MRSWYPIPVTKLDNKRLLGEHNELLIMARSIFGLNKGGYRNHPETIRWVGYSKAMKQRHDDIAVEMQRRGFNHKSPWPENCINLSDTEEFPSSFWEPYEVMLGKLLEKQGGYLYGEEG
jgi:hypothetical protein